MIEAQGKKIVGARKAMNVSMSLEMAERLWLKCKEQNVTLSAVGRALLEGWVNGKIKVVIK